MTFVLLMHSLHISCFIMHFVCPLRTGKPLTLSYMQTERECYCIWNVHTYKAIWQKESYSFLSRSLAVCSSSRFFFSPLLLMTRNNYSFICYKSNWETERARKMSIICAMNMNAYICVVRCSKCTMHSEWCTIKMSIHNNQHPNQPNMRARQAIACILVQYSPTWPWTASQCIRQRYIMYIMRVYATRLVLNRIIWR